MKVVMPQIGMTMQEGTITEWLKEDGAHVETEKMENQVEAPASGTLKIIAAVEDTIACGEDVAEIIE